MIFAKDLDKVLTKVIEEEVNKIESAILKVHCDDNRSSRALNWSFQNKNLTIAQKWKIKLCLESFGYDVQDIHELSCFNTLAITW